MPTKHTVNSRIRLLVAKAFRAEKLYASIGKTSVDALAEPNRLAELANDIRAKEWQRSHFQLRNALNDLLASNEPSELISEIVKLRSRFAARAEQSAAIIARDSSQLTESCGREEFAPLLRLSLELIRHKARLQAHNVIIEELSSILERSKRHVSDEELAEKFDLQSEVEKRVVGAEEAAVLSSKVIPLRRRAGGGHRS